MQFSQASTPRGDIRGRRKKHRGRGQLPALPMSQAPWKKQVQRPRASLSGISRDPRTGLHPQSGPLAPEYATRDADILGREAILGVHTRRVPLGPKVDLEILARATPGMAGADLENLVNEAALIAARFDKSQVEMDDFESAREKVLMGS